MKLSRRTSSLITLLLAIAGTVQYHSAQFLSWFDTFPGDRGDARGFVYFLEHWYQSLLGRSSLLSPAIFYPTKGTLAYSDLLFGFAVPYSFFRLVGFSVFTSVQLAIILITFLSFWTAFYLLYKVLNFRLAASCAGAMFFAFSSPKFLQTIHLQLQFVVLLPLIFALVITFAKQVDTMSQRKAAILAALTALCLNLQLATVFYYAWYLAVWTTIFLILALVFSPTRRFIITVIRRFWRALMIGAAAFIVSFLPILLLYIPTMRAGQWYEYEWLLEMVPDWRSILSMGAGNYVWGRLGAALLPSPLNTTWGELQIGIGLVPSLTWIVLTVLAIWWIIRRRKTAVQPLSPTTNRELAMLFFGLMILATTLFYFIGFRYSGRSPWIYVYNYFPAAAAIRAVARYVLFLTLPMSIAFAYVLHKGLEYAGGKRALTAGLIGLAAFGVFEQFGLNKIGGTGFSTRIEEAYLKTMAAKVPGDCEAFYVAAGQHPTHSIAEYQYDGMMLSMISKVPTLNASSSQFPRDWNFYFVTNADYETRVKEWIESQKIAGKVCRLEIGPQVEAFDPKTPSPIDDAEFFVRQLYRDFAGPEPEPDVVATQVEKIKNCKPTDEACDRDNVALNVFLSTGFHEKGFFVVQMYEVGLGRAPSYREFTDAMHRISEYQTTQPPDLVKERMLTDLVKSPEFAQSNDSGREQALRQSVGSEGLRRQLNNRGFVILQYFGYLQRDPDPASLKYWTDQLDRSGNATEVIEGFITSVEYRDRFRH